MNDKSKEIQNVQFSGLILGFSSAALSYLGFSPDGHGGGPSNLDLAKQNIEIIKLLKEKTAGNLTEDEKHLTDEVPRDLMFKFSETTKKTQT